MLANDPKVRFGKKVSFIFCFKERLAVISAKKEAALSRADLSFWRAGL